MRQYMIIVGLISLIFVSGCTEKQDELKDFEITNNDVLSKITNKDYFKLLDVRENDEYKEGHIENTLLLSVNNITQKELDKLGLKKDDEIIVYCRSGKRSAKAYEILNSLGYTNVKSMAGGIILWTEKGFPVVKEEQTD